MGGVSFCQERDQTDQFSTIVVGPPCDHYSSYLPLQLVSFRIPPSIVLTCTKRGTLGISDQAVSLKWDTSCVTSRITLRTALRRGQSLFRQLTSLAHPCIPSCLYGQKKGGRMHSLGRAVVHAYTFGKNNLESSLLCPPKTLSTNRSPPNSSVISTAAGARVASDASCF